jgi:hypothetical protein
MIERHVLNKAADVVEEIKKFHYVFQDKKSQLNRTKRRIKYGSGRASRHLRKQRLIEEFDLKEDLDDMVNDFQMKYNSYISRNWDRLDWESWYQPKYGQGWDKRFRPNF